MDLRLFSTFLRVAELQNFTKAAEQLGYSQATVTVQIHQLEQALGIQLFERIGKRVRMTEHGEQFIPYAIEILKAEQNAKDFLREPENPSGRLRIGADAGGTGAGSEITEKPAVAVPVVDTMAML